MLTVPLFKAVTTIDKLYKTKWGRTHLASMLTSPLRLSVDYQKLALGLPQPARVKINYDTIDLNCFRPRPSFKIEKPWWIVENQRLLDLVEKRCIISMMSTQSELRKERLSLLEERYKMDFSNVIGLEGINKRIDLLSHDIEHYEQLITGKIPRPVGTVVRIVH